MRIGMIGLGRMGANMVRRLLTGGHECVVFDMSPKAVEDLVHEKAVAAIDLRDLVQKLPAPRAVWLMVPAAAVDQTISHLVPLLDPGDTIIDGGNSYYVDDIRRAKELTANGIHYVDVGTSGGVWGLERGYCMMIGGEAPVVHRLDPIFRRLAPGPGDVPPTPGREKLDGTAELGYLHCGPNGAGHFVKMVHNGIEYGLMAAYAEGLGVLRQANVGKQHPEVDAETTPLRQPEHYQYELNLRDIAEVWRHRGSVVASLAARFDRSHAGSKTRTFQVRPGRVSGSKRPRAAGPSTPPSTKACRSRCCRRRCTNASTRGGEADYPDTLLSAMRYQFGGHLEKAGEKQAA